MSKFVRTSKYRHVFGTGSKPQDTYQELRVSRSAWDSNGMCANPYYIAVNWEVAGGGFAVIPHGKYGKLGNSVPIFTGHKGTVLDTQFAPFNDQLIASASEDCTAKIWVIPEGGPKSNVDGAAVTLSGHGRKVGLVSWSPNAANVLATQSTDLTSRIWDVEAGAEKLKLEGHTDMPLDFCWDHTGGRAVTVAKDKTIKTWDIRTATATSSGANHPGIKGSRAVWLGDKEKIFTFGFSKMSERQYSIYDVKDLANPLTTVTLDSSAGIIIPMYDADTGVLFLAGKGDGNVRYLEMVDEAPYAFSLSEYKSSTPQKGMCMMGKRSVNTGTCEIAKMFKLTASAVEPISFCVPRKAEIFQDDIFPPTAGGVAGMSAEEYFAGKDLVAAATISLDGGFVPVASSFNGVEQAAPAAAPSSDVGTLQKELAALKEELAKKDARIAELEAAAK